MRLPRAVKRQASSIRFELHPEFGLGSHVRRMECKLESTRPLDSGYMLRILDQDAVLRDVQPTLRSRGGAAHGSEAPARLNVRDGIGDDRRRPWGTRAGMPAEAVARAAGPSFSSDTGPPPRVARSRASRHRAGRRVVADGAISPWRRVLLRAGPVLRTVTGAHKGRPYTRAVFAGPHRVQRGIGDRLGSHAARGMGHRITRPPSSVATDVSMLSRLSGIVREPIGDNAP